jgi:imidazole glycerol phosphate synthase glutamine amidotransferase subunit|tara:strand:+ start:399 stop:1010 length:612 start_codon:yes stop_codon:yes gene_type:complete
MNSKGKIGILKLPNRGNLNSIKDALEYCDANVGFIETNDDFNKFDKIVLPGVGAFNKTIENIIDKDMKNELVVNVNNKITLGICLGMQLFAKSSDEIQLTEGLNILNCNVKKIKTKYPLPVIGYNNIKITSDNKLLKNINESDQFYFMHSYAVSSTENQIASVKYHNTEYTAAVAKDNVFGVQFHIEKSKKSGIKVINNFLNL